MIHDEFTQTARQEGISRQAIWQRRAKRDGRCWQCGTRATKGGFCERHWRENRIRAGMAKSGYTEAEMKANQRRLIERAEKTLAIAKRRTKWRREQFLALWGEQP